MVRRSFCLTPQSGIRGNGESSTARQVDSQRSPQKAGMNDSPGHHHHDSSSSCRECLEVFRVTSLEVAASKEAIDA